MARGQDFQSIPTVDHRLRAVTASSSHVFPRHSHDEFGIGIMLCGGQISASGRGQVISEPGDIMTVNPGEVHDGAPLGRGDRRWLMLYMEPEIISSIQQGLDIAEQVEFERPVFTNRPAAQQFYATFQAATDRVAPSSLLALEESMLHLLAPLISVRVKQDTVKCDGAMARVRQMICDNLMHNPSLTELAEVANASPFQTLRAFRAFTGLTPHAFILQERANRARRLITSGESLADVAAACGYADQSHMTREFKRRYGMTPAAFRA
ncbi:AraC family transcriptional regulator [Rhizobium sp.]|jgi:AraC-like DNA-binding protein|uniref:helix-turn-helix transcriptional regulator n=1 Tax=Rhizobium sp. TaxID=391 RepID=UPI000E9E14F9|nr:AraC family transcriptional regulator [Rhizobium sp.]